MKNLSPTKIAYEHIKHRIINKTLFPGNRVIEEEIVRESNVSRTSIRTAMQKLQYEGFLEIFPNRGAYVVKPTLEEMRQVYEIRTLLEERALALAIPRLTETTLSHLRANLEAQRHLGNQFNIPEYAELNREFHWEIACASQNPYLQKYLNELLNKSSIYLIFYDNSTDDMRSLEIHGAILDAMERRDLDAALQALRRDVDFALETVREVDASGGQLTVSL